MNVKLKKDYNKSWLANAELGGGTTFFRNQNDKLDGKYLGRLFALRFTDRSRLNLYAMVNNLNDQRTPGEKGEWSPLTQSQGLTTTYRVGGGYFYDKEDRLRYEGSANASYYDKLDQQHSSSETFLQGGNTFGKSLYQKRSYDVELNTEHRLLLRRGRYSRVRTATSPSWVHRAYMPPHNWVLSEPILSPALSVARGR